MLVLAVLGLLLGSCYPQPEIISLTSAEDVEEIAKCPCCDFQLSADITVDDHTPIKEFSGSLNGNGKTLVIRSFNSRAEGSRLGFFSTIYSGQVFNLTVIGPSSLSLGGGITHFGLLAGEAIDPFFYHIQLLTETTVTTTNAQTSSKSWKYYGGLVGNLLLEGHPMANVLSSSTLNFDFPDYNSYIAVGSLFGAVSGSQRISSVRTSDISVLQVSAPAARRIICGGLVGSVKASRIFSTAVSEGSTLSVTHGASNAEVYLGGLAGEGSQFDYVDSAWVEVECKGNNSTTLQGTCYIGGFVGQLVSTYLDTRLTKGARTRSLGYLRCGDTRTCYVGGLAAYMLHSDISQCESSINIEVDNVVNANVGGLIGLNTGGRILDSSTVSESIFVASLGGAASSGTFRVGGLIGGLKRSSAGAYSEVASCSVRIGTLDVISAGTTAVGGVVGHFDTASTGDARTRADNDEGGELRTCGCVINVLSVRADSSVSKQTGDLMIGGLAGYSHLARFVQSYAAINTTSFNCNHSSLRYGGVVARMNTSCVDSSFAKLETVTVAGNVTKLYVGGIAGEMIDFSSIYNSYASMDNISLSGKVKNLYYGGAVGTADRYNMVTGSFAMTKFSSVTPGTSTTRLGAFAGDLKSNSNITGSWANGNFTVATSASTGTEVSLGGFVGFTSGSDIIASYSHGNFTLDATLDASTARVGAFIGFLGQGATSSYTYTIASFSKEVGSKPIDFFGKVFDSNSDMGTENVLCTNCGSNIARQATTIPTTRGADTPVHYGDYSTITNPNNYKLTNGVNSLNSLDWSGYVYDSSSSGNSFYYLLNSSRLPVLIQPPNPKGIEDATASGSSTNVLNGLLTHSVLNYSSSNVCKKAYRCWTYSSATRRPGLWLNPNKTGGFPMLKNVTNNTCTGLCYYENPPALPWSPITCSPGKNGADFTCQQCGGSSGTDGCNGGTCRRDGICVDCPLGYVGQDCRTAVCMSPSKTPCGGSDTNDPAGQCTLWNGMPVCECNSTFYTYENVCVMRHANWNRVPHRMLSKNLTPATGAAVAVLIISLLTLVGAVLAGLAFFGILKFSCQKGRMSRISTLNGSMSHLTISRSKIDTQQLMSVNDSSFM
ncbi:hypothetical protein GMRT_15093 [Giardia muris]|uniref:EGF-like domain-containing protein n=1 Tax=Giardia muris TaxID=5742 RepID=A0A4Z1SMP6_GIAMU|nr:hypothetical protein GMRT_15093 [Giardia muris]|eukprot:TNJ26966.1 hypothetical protein GMRT_15093 [Giardia muris]